MEREIMEKEELRAYYKNLREGLSEAERWSADDHITERFTELKAYQNAECILTYLSMGKEVETRGIIQRAWLADKSVAIPRCIPGTNCMEWYMVSSLDGLVENHMGIWEPVSDPGRVVKVSEVKHALAVVPGLAFDRVGYRIGYGGGFYDRFLADFMGISVGLCRDGFITEQSLRFDEHDISVDMVLTQTQMEGLLFFGAE